MDKRHPPCVDDETFDRWALVNFAGAPFCTDCLPGYKREQLRLGNCSHPEVAFRVDEDGFTEGYFPALEGQADDDGCLDVHLALKGAGLL